LRLPYLEAARADARSGFKNAWTRVVRTNSELPNVYLVKASARVDNKVRTVQAVVIRQPASGTFDYDYFLNNWAWWWGSPIAGNGGNRANWDFDFRHDPTINGPVVSSGGISENGVPVTQLTNNPPFTGMAGQDPLALVHTGAPRLSMPNLKNLSPYEAIALADTRTNGLWLGSTQVVAGVHQDAVRPGLYLVGTEASPIVISNTVVVRGDVVIRGKITGQGTLYVGGNLYIGGNLTYKNGPDWTVPPETMTPTQRDQWVSNNRRKDLVGMAVRGSILAGDVTSSTWKTWCFDPEAWGLGTVGDERHLGADGIMNTGDDYIAYTQADGTVGTGFDADGNGVIDGNYDYYRDITMTSTRAAKIARYPTDAFQNPVPYGTLATSTMNTLDGVFYTNHGAAMLLLQANAVFHGTLVSRNEAVIFNSHCGFNYDSRVHSRYSTDPNRYVNLGLPTARSVRLVNFTELPPDRSNL
jgi:hypothetical protein